MELAAPIIQASRSLLSFLGVLFIFIQAEKGYGYWKFEKTCIELAYCWSCLWLIGSIRNSCQTYERAGGHVQIFARECPCFISIGKPIVHVGCNLKFSISTSNLDMYIMGWNSVLFNPLLVCLNSNEAVVIISF